MNTINVKNQPAELNASTVLMVSNISRNVSKKHLYEIFSQYGDLKGVYVPRNEETKVQKPYIFLEYANQENAEKAMLYFSGGQIDGIIVKVEILNPDNLINNSINVNVNTINKSKEENTNDTNRSYRDKTRDNPNFPENEYADDINLDFNNLENIDAKKNLPLADVNFNKSQVKRPRSRSRSRKRSRSNSYPRYKRDNNYKSNQNHNNYYPYGGSRRNQDYNRRKYRKRNSKSSGKSSDRSSSKSSKSSS